MPGSGEHINAAQISWQSRPASLSIPPTGIVDIWYISLYDVRSTLEQDFRILSIEEQKRTKAFKFTEDQQRFIAGHAALRRILGAYINCAPEAIQYNYSDFGKPLLNNSIDLSFNISHKANHNIVAVTSKVAIGVDVEIIDRSIEIASLVQTYFTSREVSTILNADLKDRHKFFYSAWTRKESFIKCQGNGLSLPLDQFEVTILPSDPVQLEMVRFNEHSRPEDWSMLSFGLDDDLMGSITLHGRIHDVRFFQYSSL